MAYLGLGVEPQPSFGAALLGTIGQGLQRQNEFGQQMDLQKQHLALQQQAQRAQLNNQHLQLLGQAAQMDPDIAKRFVDVIKQQRESMGLPTSDAIANFAAALKPEDADLWNKIPALRDLVQNPTQAMEKPDITQLGRVGVQLTQARAQRDAQQEATDAAQPPQGPGVSGAGLPPQPAPQQPPAAPMEALDGQIQKINAAILRLASMRPTNRLQQEQIKSTVGALNTERTTLEARRNELMKVIPMKPGEQGYSPATGGFITPPPLGSATLPPTRPSNMPGFMIEPSIDQQTGKVTEKHVPIPGYNAEQERAVRDYMARQGWADNETNRDKAREALAKRNVTTRIELSQPTLSKDAVEEAAKYLAEKGEFPAGFGFGNPRARTQVWDRAAQILKEQGPGASLASRSAFYKANATELTRLQSQRGPVMAFAETADRNLTIAEQLSDKVDRTQIPAVNKWLLTGQQNWQGDPKVASFAAAVRTAVNEYARVTTTVTGGGVTSDSARHEVEQLLSTAQTPQQFREVVKTLRLEMGNRKRGYDDQIKQTQDRIKGFSGASQPEEPTTASKGRAASQGDVGAAIRDAKGDRTQARKLLIDRGFDPTLPLANANR